MLNNLGIAHLTGTATIKGNDFFTSYVNIDRPARSIDQMFFKPYESKHEFIFCARMTILPLLLLGIAILDPVCLITVPAIYLSASLGFLVAAGVNKAFGNERSASNCLNMADQFISRFYQLLVTSIVLPIAVLFLLTRSISTGLQAAGIYDHDASPADALPVPAI